MLRVKASRVDKLQVELNSLREKLEDSSRHQAKLKVHIHTDEQSVTHCMYTAEPPNNGHPNNGQDIYK